MVRFASIIFIWACSSTGRALPLHNREICLREAEVSGSKYHHHLLLTFVKEVPVDLGIFLSSTSLFPLDPNLCPCLFDRDDLTNTFPRSKPYDDTSVVFSHRPATIILRHSLAQRKTGGRVNERETSPSWISYSTMPPAASGWRRRWPSCCRSAPSS